jgi:competence ComEA-like helix-hairpin-helix protein
MASGKATIDHEYIKQWVEQRGGKPAHVKGRGDENDPGILRIDFPGYSGEGSLEEISWDQWFEGFEANNLAIILQEQTADGQESRFNKLVSRDSVDPEDVREEDQAQGQEQAQPESARRMTAEESGYLDLNTANLEQLEALEGIGPVRAQAIIDYRTENGPFEDIDELEDIQGFDGVLVARVSEQAMVGEPRRRRAS